ncbi:MAG TPA: GAF domain-containing protein, partial [Terriglobales bacterium]|nr:GAF domain-containing protein [Terriglobales bacterium]
RGNAREDVQALAEINRVGRLVSAELDLPRLVQAVTDAATQLSSAEFGAFFYNVVDRDGERFTLYALSGVPREAFERFPMPRNTALFGPTFRGEGVIRLDDVRRDPRYGKMPPHHGMPAGHLPVVSYLSVPVVSRTGEALGGLFFGHPEPAMFKPRHEQIVVALAAQAAVAMENARRYEEEQRARGDAEAAERRAAFLADAGTVIGSALTDEALLHRVAELAVPRVADWCAVFLRHEDGAIRCVAFRHAEPAKDDAGRRYIEAQPIDPGAPYGVARVIRTGVTEVTNDITEAMLRAVSHDEEGVRMRVALGHRAVLVVPLRSGARVVGAIAFGRGSLSAYGPADVALAEDLARRVSLAIENAALYREAREARERAERAQGHASLLAEASRVLGGSLDYDATLDALVRLVVPSLADWSVIHIIRRDGGLRRIGPAYADPRLGPLADELRRQVPTLRAGSASGTMSVLLSGKPLLVPEVSRDWLEAAIQDERYRSFVARLEPRSLMIVPLAARGRTLGVLTMVSLQPARRYGEADLTLAEDLGRRAAVAIDNARLYRQTEQAHHDAEAANRAKDEFLAVLSHELRTPLNAVSGWLKMVEAGTLQGAQAERALTTVGRNVAVLRRLIEDLLDVSGIIAGKLTLERAPCDLASVVEHAVEALEGEATGKGVHCAVTAARALVVEADALRLRQVVTNLLTNAIKFTPAGGVVTVTVERRERDAVITVADTGAGIDPSMLPHVFERFRQADSSSTRRHGGLGLGLAIVKHIVELHGGTVRAESRGAGHGATFVVALPLAA